MFFQNVDAIVGPDEPIVYPEHLTKELDYALPLSGDAGAKKTGSNPEAYPGVPGASFRTTMRRGMIR